MNKLHFLLLHVWEYSSHICFIFGWKPDNIWFHLMFCVCVRCACHMMQFAQQQSVLDSYY